MAAATVRVPDCAPRSGKFWHKRAGFLMLCVLE